MYVCNKTRAAKSGASNVNRCDVTFDCKVCMYRIHSASNILASQQGMLSNKTYLNV